MEMIMKYTKNIWKLTLILGLLLSISACSLEETPSEPTPTVVDPAAIFTAAAETVAAQLTQTAIAFSPTPAPATATSTMAPTATLVNLDAATPIGGIPTLTLQPGVPTLVPTLTPATILNTPDGPICDEMTYGSPVDVNYPDGSEVSAGTDFEKIWRVYNTGVCTWDDGYILVPVSGYSEPDKGDTNPLDAPNPAWELKANVAPGEVVDIGVNLTAPLANGTHTTCFILQNDRGVNFGGVLCVVVVVNDGN
jgi:hypothetical protein